MKKIYRLGSLAVLAAAIGLLYLPTLDWLWDEWFKTGVRFYSHGVLVIPISLFLIWRQRATFASARPWLMGLPLLLTALGLGVFTLLQRPPFLYTYSLSAYSLLILILGFLLVICGRTVTRQILFPVLFLALAIPAPFTGQLADFLAKIVAAGSAALAGTVGIDVVREGTLVMVGGYTYSIEPLCSSLNMILALFTLVLPILYLKHFSPLKSALFLLATPAAALVFKMLLITSVYWMTQNGGQEAALNAYHGWAGMLTFGISLITLLFPILFLGRDRDPISSTGQALTHT